MNKNYTPRAPLPRYLGRQGALFFLIVAGLAYFCIPSDLSLSLALYNDEEIGAALEYLKEAVARTKDATSRASQPRQQPDPA